MGILGIWYSKIIMEWFVCILQFILIEFSDWDKIIDEAQELQNKMLTQIKDKNSKLGEESTKLTVLVKESTRTSKLDDVLRPSFTSARERETAKDSDRDADIKSKGSFLSLDKIKD